MRQKRRGESSSGGRAARTLWAAVLAALPLSNASAAEIKLPPTKPVVVFDVPDDWTIDKSGKAVDMRSPEKNAIVVAEVVARGKTAIESWSKEATTKLKSFGVAFDQQAKAPPKPPSFEDESAFTKSPDKFTFSGQPSLATPGTPGSNDPVKPGKLSIEALTGLGTDKKPQPAQPMSKLPFRAVQYYGATLNGKSVDVQLVIYNLSENRVLLMMQESGADDGRTVTMAASVRGAKPAKAAPRRAPKQNQDAKSGQDAQPAQEAQPAEASPQQQP